MTRAQVAGAAAARWKSSSWATSNPYKAARQRREWADARAAAESWDDFQVWMRGAEAYVARAGYDDVAAAVAATAVLAAFPRHARGLTAASLTVPNPPPFNILTHDGDGDRGCAWCRLDQRLVCCACGQHGTAEQRFAHEWDRAWGGLGYVVLAQIVGG